MAAWIKAGDRTYPAIARKPNGTCHHLIVMKGKHHHWRWVAWCEGTPKDQGYCGHSRGVLDAMKAAEHAITCHAESGPSMTLSQDSVGWRARLRTA
jgi:hypothetical protein